MMLPIVRVNAVRGKDHSPISLVSIDGGGTNASMGINPCENDRIRQEMRQSLVKNCAVEGAVSLLDDMNIRRLGRQLRKNLATRCPFDRDAYALGFHLQEGVSQIRLELL